MKGGKKKRYYAEYLFFLLVSERKKHLREKSKNPLIKCLLLFYLFYSSIASDAVLSAVSDSDVSVVCDGA